MTMRPLNDSQVRYSKPNPKPALTTCWSARTD